MMAVRPDLVDLSKAEAQVPPGVIDMDKATIIWDIGRSPKPALPPSTYQRQAWKKGAQMLEVLTGADFRCPPPCASSARCSTKQK